MITTKDVVRYNIHQCSDRIKEIKVSCINRQTYINPAEKDWKQYTGLKFECSKWLSALNIIKMREYLEHPAEKKCPVAKHTPKGYTNVSFLNTLVIPALHKIELEFKEGKAEAKYNFIIKDWEYNKKNEEESRSC